jgi:hypothetical protein
VVEWRVAACISSPCVSLVTVVSSEQQCRLGCTPPGRRWLASSVYDTYRNYFIHPGALIIRP